MRANVEGKNSLCKIEDTEADKALGPDRHPPSRPPSKLQYGAGPQQALGLLPQTRDGFQLRLGPTQRQGGKRLWVGNVALNVRR